MLATADKLGTGVKLTMQRFFKKIYQYIINPPGDAELNKAWQVSNDQLPTLWLLGKTGSGKSSIVQKLTGQSEAEIGNGYMPCTKDARAYDYPASLPILRFLDTRGLGEIGYDPRDDITVLGQSSHALLIAMCVTDSLQSEVLHAIKLIQKSHSKIGNKRVMVVHTAVTRISDDRDRQRAVAEKQGQVEQAWGTALDFCTVDFHETEVEGVLNDFGADELRDMLIEKLPELSLWLEKSEHRDAEQANFERLKKEVLWYAAAVAGTDAIPALGLFSVPSIQGKMLHSLAQKYELKWDRRNFAEFTGALGGSALLWYGASLGGRQLVKLIPIYGQIAGTAIAMSVSYASTYAIGRAACSYLYHKKTKTNLAASDLQNVYKKAAKQGKAAKDKMGKGAGS